MKILIPVNKKDRFLSIISSIEENSAWAVVSLDGAKIVNVEFFDRVEEIFCLINKLVVINDMEYVWPFLEDGIEVLIALKEKSIDEIIESILLDRLKRINA
ncbi:hypothetical protein AFAEC_1274 [Aliarcobacter faecis]|uniref:hypothetical protein n=1 Tax=Aliarcobacter faecis TaxID=1564138 RepID=UPI00047D0146|nr:hypothetical protein [Aliarcobacter faecis]QKF73435.1 hypothetical protein AFAEC_1274 [Aliarcobacter faecis]